VSRLLSDTLRVSSPEPVLGRVLDLEGSACDASTRSRCSAARSVEPVDFLQVTSRARLRDELQPRHSTVPHIVLADDRAGRSRGSVVLGEVALAERHGGRVEVEEGRRGVGEVVVTRDDEVGGRERLLVHVGEVEDKRDLGQGGEDVGVACRDAGRVEESCERADLGGSCSGIGATSIVLCSSSDGDVLQCEAC